jgi:mRNA-degrading endonuclease YafQ of YafQ-DinJ toxin-antitoxin module
MKVVLGRQFKISFKSRIAADHELSKSFQDALALFMTNPEYPKLRTHKLHGLLANYHAFSVAPDCRVIFKKLPEDTFLFIDIGSHDEVY